MRRIIRPHSLQDLTRVVGPASGTAVATVATIATSSADGGDDGNASRMDADSLRKSVATKTAHGTWPGASNLRRSVQWKANCKQPLARNVASHTLLRKVLDNEEDAFYWRIKIAQTRSLRLAILLLQMLIRKEESRLPGGASVLQGLLPRDGEWDRMIESASRYGHTSEDIHAYLHVVEGRSDEERCARLLERNTPGPLFLFAFLLRDSSSISKITTLNSLIETFPCYFGGEKKQRIPGDGSSASRSHQSQHLTQDRFSFVMRLLTRQCLRLEPRLIVKLANVAVQYIEKVATFPGEHSKLYWTQCLAFNNTLRTFQSLPGLQPVQRSFPNAYIWEAQRTLLATFAGLRKPLLVQLEGFRAVRQVLAGQAKNWTEMHSSARHAATWPPYLQPADGMDERANPEDNWSRTVRAGMLMQEAGFEKKEQDAALDILEGMTTDGTPTIQQRISIGPGRRVGVWEASIRATRNAREAWEMFQKPPKTTSKPGPAEYAAMFEKLILREADPNSKLLPGDKALNFATNQEANLSEFERARLHPPSVARLYQGMRLNGIKPQGSCLRILMANSQSLELAHWYLQESTESRMVVLGLTAVDPDPELLKLVPLSLFGSYMEACTRVGGRWGGRQLMRAIRLASLRLDSERSRWTPFVWGLILKSLSQHHRVLGVSFSEQIRLFLDVMDRVEETYGMTLPLFVQFSKCIRKATRQELNELEAGLESAESANRSPLRLLYDPPSSNSIADDEQRHRRGEASSETGVRDAWANLAQLDAAISRMKTTFSSMVQNEKDRQSLLHTHNVAPLDRMSSRTDAVRSEHAYEYMISLAFVGEFDEMARTLHWLMGEWGQVDVVDAIKELDEPPLFADFSDTLCAFRLLAEPMLEEAVVDELRHALAASPVAWTWPEDETVAAYAATQDDTSLTMLRRVLDWTRHWQKARRQRRRQQQQQQQQKQDEVDE